MSEFTRDELVALAFLAELSEQYGEAIEYMKQVVKMGTPLNRDERHIIIDSFTRLKFPLFKSWYYANEMKNEKTKRHLDEKNRAKFNEISDEIFELLDSQQIKKDERVEAVIEYKAFRAVLHSDKAKFAEGKQIVKKIKKAFEAFEEAWKIAKESLKAAHPIRLSLAREFASFLKCTDNLSEAVTMLTEAQGKALPLLPDLSGDLKDEVEKELKKIKEAIDEYSSEEK